MSILEDSIQVLSKLDLCAKEISYRENQLNTCDADILVLSKKKELILSAKEYHKKAVDILYQTSIKELEDLINDVVSAVFYDRNLLVKMELTDSRSKSLVWYLIDLDKDIQLSVKNGIGRGVRTVLSFIIQSYYILSLGSKYMFIDEGYSFISEAYVGKFFEFVKMLCDQKGLSLVMISHDDRFSGYANKCYGVLNGRIYTNTNQSYQEFKKWLNQKQSDIESTDIGEQVNVNLRTNCN